QFLAMEQSKVAGLLYAVEHTHVAILAAMFDLSKRAVVLTGATGNVGPAVLRAYVQQGRTWRYRSEKRPRALRFGTRLAAWLVPRKIRGSWCGPVIQATPRRWRASLKRSFARGAV